MTGAEIVGTLLRAHAPLTALVPAKWIKLGSLPDEAPTEAILIRTVSVLDQQPLRRGPLIRSTERVAVTVRARNYRQQGVLIRMVRTVCGGFIGDLAGAERIAVRTNGLGPDLRGAGGSYEQTQDFRTSYDAAA